MSVFTTVEKNAEVKHGLGFDYFISKTTESEFNYMAAKFLDASTSPDISYYSLMFNGYKTSQEVIKRDPILINCDTFLIYRDPTLATGNEYSLNFSKQLIINGYKIKKFVIMPYNNINVIFSKPDENNLKNSFLKSVLVSNVFTITNGVIKIKEAD
jgi:hypothetical protein